MGLLLNCGVREENPDGFPVVVTTIATLSRKFYSHLLTITMKLYILFLVLTTAAAFTHITSFGVSRIQKTSSQVCAESSHRINDSIDLASPKVVNQEKLNSGEKKVYCRCWKSGTFPLCDAAHVKHNEENGDNVGPLIVACTK